jgi:site-specific DNA-methyltransferase (adenine-specific)
VPELAESNRFTIAVPNKFYIDTVCGITLQSKVDLNLRYILGLLNSSLIEWLYKQTTVPKANSFYIYKTMFLKRIPIRMIDFKNYDDVNHYDRIISLVDQILSLKKPDPQADIGALEAEIDQLVYKLYNLTPEEIKIVEESLRR